MEKQQNVIIEIIITICFGYINLFPFSKTDKASKLYKYTDIHLVCVTDGVNVYRYISCETFCDHSYYIYAHI